MLKGNHAQNLKRDGSRMYSCVRAAVKIPQFADDPNSPVPDLDSRPVS